MHYLNFQSFPSPFSIPKLHLKYTKEILKNTKDIAFARGGAHLPIAHALGLLSTQRFGLTKVNFEIFLVNFLFLSEIEIEKN